MKLPFSLFLAFRYLKPKRTFVSIITLISILGVTLGIAVLIIVISVMTGFDQELRKKVLSFDAHVVVMSEDLIYDWRDVIHKIEKTPGIVAAAPFVQGPVIVEFQGRRLAPKIRGIDLEEEEKVTSIKNFLVEGKLDLSGDTTVLGKELANSLDIHVGEKLIVYSPGNIGNIIEEVNKIEKTADESKRLADLKELILPTELTVTGIFESGRFIYDSEFLLVPIHIGQELYGLGDSVHGITIKTDDPEQVEEVKREIMKILTPPAHASTWIDNNKSLFDAILMERNVMFFLLMFIIIVAAFGIMNTLITVTVQKTREIGILKAIGANTGQIIWVFLAQGMVVGFFGNVTGLALGMTLVKYRNEFKDWLAGVMGIQIFPADVYQLSSLPAKVIPHDVAIICVSAFVICSLAALIPAYFAARLDPVKALRYD